MRLGGSHGSFSEEETLRRQKHEGTLSLKNTFDQKLTLMLTDRKFFLSMKHFWSFGAKTVLHHSLQQLKQLGTCFTP